MILLNELFNQSTDHFIFIPCHLILFRGIFVVLSCNLFIYLRLICLFTFPHHHQKDFSRDQKAFNSILTFTHQLE